MKYFFSLFTVDMNSETLDLSRRDDVFELRKAVRHIRRGMFLSWKVENEASRQYVRSPMETFSQTFQ